MIERRTDVRVWFASTKKGCVALIYPAAFNTTTGPLHWDLLQRARYVSHSFAYWIFGNTDLWMRRRRRAVDNQMFIVMCSPARATSGDGYKAYGYSGVTNPMYAAPRRAARGDCKLTPPTRGKIVAQLEEKEGILFVDIGASRSRVSLGDSLLTHFRPSDVQEIDKARAGIPVTVQRRFDVYPDVSA